MNKKLVGFIGIVLSILFLVYFESFFYKALVFFGININDYSELTRIIINIVMRIIMCIIIYFIYKKDFRRTRSHNNIFKMILIFIIGVIGLTIINYLFSYVVNYLKDIFNVKLISNNFYNIFNKQIDVNLLLKILSDYIITPFIYTSIVILSVDKLTRRTDTFLLLSGLLASIIYALTLSGTLAFIIINSLSIFIIFIVLSFIYDRFKSIWLVILIYSFYLISNVIILNYLGL